MPRRALLDASQSRTIRLPVHITEKLNRIRNAQRLLTMGLGRSPSASASAWRTTPPAPSARSARLCSSRGSGCVRSRRGPCSSFASPATAAWCTTTWALSTGSGTSPQPSNRGLNLSQPRFSMTISAHPIDIGIPEAQRQQIAAGLGQVLADTSVLYAKTHGFHWNVTGPMFNTLHLMFMGQYTELWNALDVIAERIRALGFPAPQG